MNYSPFLDRAIADHHATVDTNGKKAKICYLAVNVTENFDDPEERVRAEFWAELIYRYDYPPQNIGVEVTVPDRKDNKRVDLVLFRDSERKSPYAVIECKRDGITDSEFLQAVEQAVSYGTWAILRADYVAVVAGMTRRVLDFTAKFPIGEREKNRLADLPRRYGRPLEWRYYKGGSSDIGAVSDDTLARAISKCHQTLWGGGRLSPTGAFGELCKIIFVKINDEKAKRKNGDPYQFQVKTHEADHALAGRIKKLYDEHKLKDPEVFTETIRVADGPLSLVVTHLEGINLSATNLDVKGQAFQEFMDRFFKGDFGQYFTPRPLIQFAVAMLAPTSDDVVLDPACGSGGFLLEAMDAVRREAGEYHEAGSADYDRHWHDFAQHNLFGIEINDEIARVAKMNMILHDDGHTNVIGEDALDRLNQIRQKTGNNGFAEGRFSLVLTNPPFGASVNRTERNYLEDYDLGHAGEGPKRKLRNAQKTEILFLERIAAFLKPGTGRAAIVVPDGILTNSSLQYVRDFLLERFRLRAVVSLPPYAFAHFGAGVKSSIVFVTRRAPGEQPSDEEAIFMAAPERIGYDATGRVTDSDLAGVIAQFRAFEQSPQPFFV